MNSPQLSEIPVGTNSNFVTRKDSKQKKRGVLGRKRPFNELKKALTFEEQDSSRSSIEDAPEIESEEQQSVHLDESNLKLSASKRAKTETYEK